MKVNYPLIFHKTMLNTDINNFGDYYLEALEDKITINPPNINKSYFETTIENDKNNELRVGFNVIKGVGDVAVEEIIQNRPYNTINDFFTKNSSKARNKKVVEALISAGAFDNIPLKINNILKNKIENMGYDIKEDNCVLLNRKQLIEWYKLYLEYSSKKSIPNYEFSINKIKQKYINEFELYVEDSNTVVIPETLLAEFELNINDGTKTRKRPKGKLKDILAKNTIIMDPYTRPLIENIKISTIKTNNLEDYFEEMANNGFSFTPHPLQKYASKLSSFKNSNDGEMLIEAGIITGMEEKISKNNKKYYWLHLQTPTELIRVTIWKNMFIKHRDIIKQFGFIAVKGTKGFGGMTAEDIKKIKNY